MPISRRSFLATSASALTLPYLARGAVAAVPGAPLPIPPLADATGSGAALEAAAGTSQMLDGAETRTFGFSQPFLGPTLRFRRGELARVAVTNRLPFPITSHWHGLHVPAKVDGGPMLEIAEGDTWAPEMEIDQPAATLWYHSHVHRVTAEHVYGGLAGMIQIDDPEAADDGLPSDYGIDDLPLILQDRAFASDGGLVYVKRGPTLMHGFRGDTPLVNGAVQPAATVPAGLTRLRLLNGSNARIFHLRFADARSFHRIGSDGGLLPAPVATSVLALAPAERAEILVDFSDGAEAVMLSGPDRNDPMGGGMMGGMMGGMLPGPPPQSELGRPGEFEIMRFAPDPARPARLTALPTRLAGAPAPARPSPARRRDFTLSMHGAMMGGGRRGGGGMTINGQSFRMKRIDTAMHAGEAELWTIRSQEMAHPFHVHGTSFQVVRRNGRAVDYAGEGLKDVTLVSGETQILVQVDQRADRDIPFMYHCHILEHEDAGMMGNFTVT